MVLIIGLILIGIVLIILEILVLPGMIAGIAGVLLIIFSIFWMYAEEGTLAGNITLITSLVLTVAAVYTSLKSKAWTRFGLNDTIDSKVNDISDANIKEGDEGVTVSALRPSGTVLINNRRVEASAVSGMIDAATKVLVVKVVPGKILVKIKVTAL